MARAIAERYKTRGHDGSRTRSSTFYLLVDLMFFFDLYHQKQNEEALDVSYGGPEWSYGDPEWSYGGPAWSPIIEYESLFFEKLYF